MVQKTRAAQPIVSEQAEPDGDWESPAGGEQASARLWLPDYVFQGAGDPHWTGQRCEVVDDGSEGDLQLALLACGCRTRIHRSELKKQATRGASSAGS